MTAAASIKMIPLKSLAFSSLNARKSEYKTIEDLVASIPVHGLIQNLTVVRSEDKADMFEVVAGGRRLNALLELEHRGTITMGYMVPCAVVDQADALGISTVENTAREAMHPADEFEAFKAMLDAGQSVDDVAAAYGVSTLVVRQRMKLANCATMLIDAYRKGDISMAALQAYALTDDHERQVDTYMSLGKHGRDSVYSVRDAMSRGKLPSTDSLVKYVGLDAYRKAGGAVEEDMFSGHDNKPVQITDTQLLNNLAQTKLAKYAKKISRDWTWVKAIPRLDYAERTKYGQVQMVRKAPAPEVAERMKALQAEMSALDIKYQALEASEDDDSPEGDDLLAQHDKLANELRKLDADLLVPNPEHQRMAGAIVTVDNGKVKVYTDMIKPEDRAAANKAVVEESTPGDAAGDGAAELASTGLSDRMTTRLTAHRTQALRAELANTPMVALAWLTTHMVFITFDLDASRYWGMQILKLRVDHEKLDKHAEDMPDAKATQFLEERKQLLLQKLAQALPGDLKGQVQHTNLLSRADVFGWLLEQDTAEVLKLLAFCTAHGLNDVRSRTGEIEPASEAGLLANELGLDMNRWWHATSSSFFDFVPKSTAVAAVQEVLGEESAKKVQAAKKLDASQMAMELLEGRRWLPSPLRVMHADGGNK